MHLKLIATIGEEPVPLELAKSHLRVVGTHDDGLIERYVKAARKAAENYINQAIVLARYEQTGDRLERSFELLKHPVQQVESIYWGEYQYIETDYHVRSNYLYLPVVDGLEPAFDAGKVTYTAGFEEVPEDIVSAILLILGHLYENRESVVVGVTVTEVPMGAKWLLDPYRLLKV